jgi:hypothetical protein
LLAEMNRALRRLRFAVQQLRRGNGRSKENCERDDLHLPDAPGGGAGFAGIVSEMRDVA